MLFIFLDMTLKNPTESTREMDFNALVDLLINTGYTPEYYPLKVNRIVEVLNGMSEADYKDYCHRYVKSPSYMRRTDMIPARHVAQKKCKVAIMRYSQSVIPFE